MSSIRIKKSDGTAIDDTHPLRVSLGSEDITIDNVNVDIRDLSSATDSVTTTPANTVDTNVSLNGEIVSTNASPSVIGPFTIANGQSLSSEVDLGGAMVYLLSMPDAFTGTKITFQVSRTSGGTFKDLYSGGVEVSNNVVAGKMESLDQVAGPLYGARYIKIRSGTSGSPTAEAAERTFYLITK